MKYYFVRTNGYDMYLVDDGEKRYAFADCPDEEVFAGHEKPEMYENAKNALIKLADNVDTTNAGWEVFDESVEEIIGEDCEILAEYSDGE